MKFGYGEDLLQFIWQHQLYEQTNLTTECGKTVTILKQGRLNKNSGPDFENAKIKIDNTIHHGSVEIHVLGKSWKEHKHHQDSSYNNVVLHVCYNTNGEVARQDGTIIPEISLASKIDKSSLTKYENLMIEKPFVLCQNQISNISSFEMLIWIDRMAVERLESKCKQNQDYLKMYNGHWNQAFYTAILRGFGVPINSVSFEELAAAVPYELVLTHSESLFQLEALFFGCSGLLQEKIENTYYVVLQKEFEFLTHKYRLRPINTDLKFGKMRPMNLPHVKLAQLAALFHNKPKIVSEMLELPDFEKAIQLFDFQLSDYWSTHYSFAKKSKNMNKSLSQNFVSLLFINAIVPFVFYYEKQKKKEVSQKVEIYLQAISAEKNSILDNWKKLNVPIKNAHDSQALLHLYKTYCTKRLCLECSIGQKTLLR